MYLWGGGGENVSLHLDRLSPCSDLVVAQMLQISASIRTTVSTKVVFIQIVKSKLYGWKFLICHFFNSGTDRKF